MNHPRVLEQTKIYDAGWLDRPPTNADLATDLLRLEAHYREEAARLLAEADDARKAARACRKWRCNLPQQRAAASEGP